MSFFMLPFEENSKHSNKPPLPSNKSQPKNSFLQITPGGLFQRFTVCTDIIKLFVVLCRLLTELKAV